MAKTSFEAYLNPLGSLGEDSADKTKTYGDYAQDIWGVSASTPTVTVGEAGQIQEAGDTHGFGQEMQSLAHKVIGLGKRIEHITGLLNKAEIANDAHGYGLDDLMKHYKSERTTIQDVVLPKELVDRYGGDPDKLKFGARNLSSNAEEAAIQVAQLKEQAKLAEKYLDNQHGQQLQVHVINYGGGKPPVAIIMGVDAEEFNAVIRAEKERALLTKEHQTAREQLADATKIAVEKPDVVDKDKMAKLEAMFPKKTQQQPEHAANEVSGPAATPGQQTSKEREVA